MTSELLELGDFFKNPGYFDAHTAIKISTVQIVTQAGHGPVDLSVVVPIYNRESTVTDCLESISVNVALRCQLIIVLDGCTDGTASKVDAWIEMLRGSANTGVDEVIVVTVGTSVFETLSDGIGVALSTATRIMEVQADMVIGQRGFDQSMLVALESDNNIFAVSGRGGHSWTRLARELIPGVPQRLGARARARASTLVTSAWLRNGSYTPFALETVLTDSVGRTGKRIDLPLGRPHSKFIPTDTVMRGPLVFRKADYVGVGGFDTGRFFLGNDDHDLIARAHGHEGKTVGYLPVAFDAPLSAGTTRQPRSQAETERYEDIRRFYDAAFSDSYLASFLTAQRRHGSNRAFGRRFR